MDLSPSLPPPLVSDEPPPMQEEDEDDNQQFGNFHSILPPRDGQDELSPSSSPAALSPNHSLSDVCSDDNDDVDDDDNQAPPQPPPPAPHGQFDEMDSSNWASWTPTMNPLELSEHLNKIVENLPIDGDKFDTVDTKAEDYDDRISISSSSGNEENLENDEESMESIKDIDTDNHMVDLVRQEEKEEEKSKEDEEENFADFNDGFVADAGDDEEEEKAKEENQVENCPDHEMKDNVLVTNDDDDAENEDENEKDKVSEEEEEFGDFFEPPIKVDENLSTAAEEENQIKSQENDIEDEDDDDFGDFGQAPTVEEVNPPPPPVGLHTSLLLERLVSKSESFLAEAFPNEFSAVPLDVLKNDDATTQTLVAADLANNNNHIQKLWLSLQDFELGWAVKYHWTDCHSYREFLRLLNVDHDSLMRSKQPILPAFASHLNSGGLLEPQKVDLLNNRMKSTTTTAAATTTTTTTTKIDHLSSSSSSSLPLSNEILTQPPPPPSNPADSSSSSSCAPSMNDSLFDWSSSGLMNPLPSLETSLVSSADASGLSQCFQSELTNGLDITNTTTTSLSTNSSSSGSSSNKNTLQRFIQHPLGIGATNQSGPQLSDAAQVIVDKLPDIGSFMNAHVLMFPLLSDNQQH